MSTGLFESSIIAQPGGSVREFRNTSSATIEADGRSRSRILIGMGDRHRGRYVNAASISSTS